MLKSVSVELHPLTSSDGKRHQHSSAYRDPQPGHLEVGQGAQRIRQFFEQVPSMCNARVVFGACMRLVASCLDHVHASSCFQARACAPCIVFLDELDAVGRDLGSSQDLPSPRPVLPLQLCKRYQRLFETDVCLRRWWQPGCARHFSTRLLQRVTMNL